MGDKDGDDGLDGMQCNSHPFTNSGGICASCLQEKLGKLISSSTLTFDANIGNHRHLSSEPSPSNQHHSSSSSPSFTIEAGRASAMGPPPLPSIPRLPRLKQLASSSSAASAVVHGKKLSAAAPSRPGPFHVHREDTSFASSLDKKVGGAASTSAIAATASSSSAGAILTLSRSKSVAARRAIDGSSCDAENSNSPRRKSFWSFLSFARKRGRDRGSRRRWDEKSVGFEEEEEEDVEGGAATRRKGADEALFHQQQSEKKACGIGGFEKENESPNSSGSTSYFGRKVARSRSVGCGSRSFSGDFLERLSNGFVDCTLRRVESHREAKANGKIVLHGTSAAAAAAAGGIKESVKCGGLFGGFGIYSASSSSSSSYWLSEDLRDRNGGRLSSGSGAAPPHGRINKGWGWAFASPMRAFRPSRPPVTEKDGEEGRTNNDPRSNGSGSGSGSSSNDNSKAPMSSIVTDSVPPSVVLVGGY